MKNAFNDLECCTGNRAGMINLMEIYSAFVIFTKNINFPTSLLGEKSLELLAIVKDRIRFTRVEKRDEAIHKRNHILKLYLNIRCQEKPKLTHLFIWNTTKTHFNSYTRILMLYPNLFLELRIFVYGTNVFLQNT